MVMIDNKTGSRDSYAITSSFIGHADLYHSKMTIITYMTHPA